MKGYVMKFVHVYDKATGKKLPHPVPETFLTLFNDLSLTPVQKRADNARNVDKAANEIAGK